MPNSPLRRFPLERPATLALLGFLSLLPACHEKKAPPDASVPQGPVAVAEHEPNDRPEEAQRLTQDSVVSGSLGADPSRPDVDLYVLSAAQPRMADLTLSGIPGVNVLLEVVDRDRNVVLSANGGAEGAGERIPNLRVAGDTWIRVSSDRKGAGGAYTLTVRFTEQKAGVEVEPNDRAVDAFPLGLLPSDQPLQVSGTLSHAADEDWFKVDLADVTETTGGTLPPAPAPVPGTPAAPTPIPGTPTGAGPGAAPATPTPAPPGEADEDPADAAVVAAGPATGSAAVSDAGELAGSPGDAGAPDAGHEEEARTTLHIEVSAIPNVKLELSLMSEAQAPLFTVKSKEGEGLSLRNVAVRQSDRSIFVVLKSSWIGTGKDAHRGQNADVPYTITLTREAAGANAEYEPNDDLQHATPLTRGGYREGFLSPKGDVDYFVIHADEPGLTQLQLSGVERLDLVLSVVKPNATGKEPETVLLSANDGAIKEPEVLNNVKCAPECYVKVQSGLRKVDDKFVRDYENSEQPYRLTANPVNGENLEVEPNNAPEQANPLQVGGSVRGTIHPKKDADYFKLDLSERPVKTSVTISVTGILKVDVGLYLYGEGEDGKLELVQTADRAKGEAPETIHFSAEPGVYFIVVRDSKNRESNFQDSYQLTVTEGQ